MANVKKNLKIPCAIKRYAGESDKLDIEYSVPTPTRCYVEEEHKAIINMEGKEEVSETTFYFDGTEKVAHEDIIVFEELDYAIKAIAKYRSKLGKIELIEVNC